MGFPVNADFVRVFWSFLGQVPFTLCVMAASTAEQIHNLALCGIYTHNLYLTLCKIKSLEKTSLEIHCVSTSACRADPMLGMLFLL